MARSRTGILRKQSELNTTSDDMSSDRPVYLRPDGSVDGEKLLKMVKSAPGAENLISLNAVLEGNPSMDYYYDIVYDIVFKLVHYVVLSAIAGDQRAMNQLKALDKLTYPWNYELHEKKIKELVESYQTPPSLARGWELRRLMDELSPVVEPAKGRYDLSGVVKLKTNQGLASAGAAELACKHWKPGSTLQSLAIRCYLDILLEDELNDDEEITVKLLERDLRNLRRWEERHPVGRIFRGVNNEQIVWREYSDGWKDRKKRRTLLKNSRVKKEGGK
jgi:hypothetical protein